MASKPKAPSNPLVALNASEFSNFTVRQLAVVAYLTTTGGKSDFSAVANTIGLSKPSLVRAVDKLEVYGLVQRHDVAADRRRTELSATVKGRKFVEKFLPAEMRQFDLAA